MQKEDKTKKMENNLSHPSGDKPDKSHPVGITAAVLAVISLTFLIINLWGRLPDIFVHGKVGAVMLECEAGLPPVSDTASQTVPSQSENTSATAEKTTDLSHAVTTAATAAELFPPAAANSRAPENSILSTEPNPSENVITTVITAESGKGYLEYGNIYIKNNTGYSPDLEKLLNKPLKTDTSPTVLIVHTHATECYTPTELDSYEVAQGDRTMNTEFNMVRVGEELANELRSQGIRVIHDTTLFDAESYTGAYVRSNTAVKEWIKKDPSIAVVLDLHRDALNAEGATKYRIAVESEYGDAAQMLILVGTDANGAKHPNWQNNLSLGLKLQNSLNKLCPGIMRPMLLTNGSYDQETSDGALLIEVGANGNSLSDALVSARLLATALGEILC